MTKMHRFASIAAASVLLGACGGSDEGTKAGLERLIEEYASTMCSALVTCSCSAPAAREDCEASYRLMLTAEFAETSIVYPSLTLDPAAVDACLTDLRAAVQGCPGPTHGSDLVSIAKVDDGMRMIVPSCEGERILVGTRALGEYCSGWRDCATGLACNWETRACAAAGAVGDSCTYVDCGAGLYCDGDEQCAALPAVGEPCPSWQCQPGSACVDVDGQLTCVAPRPAGEPCDAGCAEGTYCDWMAGQCTAIVADGGECIADQQCEHLWCTSEGTCGDPGFCAVIDGGDR